MIQNYEIYFILKPDLNANQTDNEVQTVSGILEKDLSATNIKIDLHGLQSTSYPIRKHRSGYYALITFDLELENCSNIFSVEKKLNVNDKVIRYLILNQSEYHIQKSKEVLNSAPVPNSRELQKGRTKKVCYVKHLGIRAIDYKDTELLSNFISPYYKIFSRERTGLSAKNQRKITKAVKRARHMGLLAFTDKYLD